MTQGGFSAELRVEKTLKTNGFGFSEGSKKDTACGGRHPVLPALLATAPQPFLTPLLTARRPLEPSGTAEKHQEAGFDAFFSSAGLLNAIQSKDQIHTGESSL